MYNLCSLWGQSVTADFPGLEKPHAIVAWVHQLSDFFRAHVTVAVAFVVFILPPTEHLLGQSITELIFDLHRAWLETETTEKLRSNRNLRRKFFGRDKKTTFEETLLAPPQQQQQEQQQQQQTTLAIAAIAAIATAAAAAAAATLAIAATAATEATAAISVTAILATEATAAISVTTAVTLAIAIATALAIAAIAATSATVATKATKASADFLRHDPNVCHWKNPSSYSAKLSICVSKLIINEMYFKGSSSGLEL